jgi:hypothetical protein
MGWLVLRTLILTPIVLAAAALILLALGINAACRRLFRRHTCAANS